LGPDQGLPVVPGVNCQSIGATVDNPTGALADPSAAQGIARAYATALRPIVIIGEASSGIDCDETTAASGEIQCTCQEAGEVTISGDLTGSDINAEFDYQDCCIEGCCFAGTGAYIFCEERPWCGSWEMTYSCGADSDDSDVDACEGDDGTIWYSIVYAGASFTVSGYYNEPGGLWAIRDAEGEWLCNEDGAGRGCCRSMTSGNVLPWGGSCP